MRVCMIIIIMIFNQVIINSDKNVIQYNISERRNYLSLSLNLQLSNCLIVLLLISIFYLKFIVIINYLFPLF